MSISMIRAQNPHGVADAGNAELGKADALDRLIGEQVREVNRLRGSWFGRGANAAISKAYRNIQAQYLEHEKLVGLHVARVRAEAVGDASQYEYWNGSTFDATQNPNTSPAILATPAAATGVGEPNVHFYDNKALATFTDDAGLIYTSSSTDGVNWTTPQLVTDGAKAGRLRVLPVTVVRGQLHRRHAVDVESLRNPALPCAELRYRWTGRVLIRNVKNELG